MSKPEDIPMTTFLVAEDLCKEVVHHWVEGREAIARAIMAAEKRGEEREREAAIRDCADYRKHFSPLPDCAAKTASNNAATIIESYIRKRREA